MNFAILHGGLGFYETQPMASCRHITQFGYLIHFETVYSKNWLDGVKLKQNQIFRLLSDYFMVNLNQNTIIIVQFYPKFKMSVILNVYPTV